MKTVIQALIDEVYYPIPWGKIENICVKRELNCDEYFSTEIAVGNSYKGALADSLYSLLQAVNFSEADKSVGALTDAQRKSILKMANILYGEIGEKDKEDPLMPKVYINC